MEKKPTSSDGDSDDEYAKLVAQLDERVAKCARLVASLDESWSRLKELKPTPRTERSTPKTPGMETRPKPEPKPEPEPVPVMSLAKGKEPRGGAGTTRKETETPDFYSLILAALQPTRKLRSGRTVVTGKRSLRELLEKFNKEMTDVPYDGNCFFHSILQLLILFGLVDAEHYDAARVRKEVVDYMDKMENLELKAVYGDWKKFCNTMRRDKVWADHTCLEAAARVYNVHIKVWSVMDEKKPFLMFPMQDEPLDDGPRVLELAFMNECHYQPVLDKA
jgi:hypothetical protein